jgi:Protein of unknown function (DUF4239)
MVNLFFNLPLIVSGMVIVGVFCLFAIGGLLFVRRFVLPRLRISHHDGHFSGTMVHSVMVFYGLALALIAVNVFETYADVSKIVSTEATSLAMLYRDISGYPEPVRSQLQKELRDYVVSVIEEDWPLQARGQVPGGGVERMSRFQNILVAFEPATEGQKLLHAEALRAYNNMTQARRMRLDAVLTHLPGVMWTVILLGAVISLSASFFFSVDDVRLHAILVTLLAIFIGLVIFMTLALDRPFVGDLGVSSDPYQLIYDHLMKP